MIIIIRFKRLINCISHEKTWTWLRKGNLKSESESLLIVAENNAIRSKGRIYKRQQNSKYRLSCNGDKTINHIISEFSKLVLNEYKTWHDWVGQVICWELCKKFLLDHTYKWYMHNPTSVLENETHKLLYDFDIQMNH